MSSLYYIDRTDIKLTDVMLNDNIKVQLEQFLKEYKYKEVLLNYNLPVSNKLLLYGQTGCGKTMTAKAIATTLNKKLIIVNLSSIVSSRLGETSKNIESLFKEIQYESAILFFDEFDSLGQIRDYDNKDNSEMKRVVNAILQLIDNLPTKSILMAATNQIHMIDPALVRRFELLLEYTVPGKQALDQYYDSMLGRFPKEFTNIERIYDISYAQAKTHIERKLKNNIIANQIAMEKQSTNS
ncbi:AAA family ATPase [Myroides sp. LJL119]